MTFDQPQELLDHSRSKASQAVYASGGALSRPRREGEDWHCDRERASDKGVVARQYLGLSLVQPNQIGIDYYFMAWY